MLAKAGKGHPLDPRGMGPLCSDQQFASILKLMVKHEAPRLFAIVQEYGDRLDAECVAWGLAFDDHTDVIGVRGDIYRGSRTPDDALADFRYDSITPHLIWVR